MKSKSVAYLLWFFLGLLGGHKFYLGKIVMGILYFFTFAFFGIGWVIDLFTLGGQVDTYNILHSRFDRNSQSQNQSQNIVVNVGSIPHTDPASAQPTTAQAQPKISAEKEILALADITPTLTLKQIITNTNLGLEEADAVIQKLVSKGLAREDIDASGKKVYIFS
jgi:TM2 domain-containing membrane protein YozV